MRLGWNVITVGAIEDYDTLLWDDDEMAAWSSWADPQSTHGDREKPEVVAVGAHRYGEVYNLTMTTTSEPWIEEELDLGTSYAARAQSL